MSTHSATSQNEPATEHLETASDENQGKTEELAERVSEELHDALPKKKLSPKDQEIEDLISSGMISEFVTSNKGQWDHKKWLHLLKDIRKEGYKKIKDKDIGELLERSKEQFQATGEASLKETVTVESGKINYHQPVDMRVARAKQPGHDGDTELIDGNQILNQTKTKDDELVETYSYMSKAIPITIEVIRRKTEYVCLYNVSISIISDTTERILDRIREQLVQKVTLGIVDLTDQKKSSIVEDKFKDTISILIEKYFPDTDDQTKRFLTSYLIQKSLGLGHLEILMDDDQLEEIVVNSGTDEVWVYHRSHGWLKSNIKMRNEEQTRHYATMVGRKVGRQFTVMEPLLDAHLNEGDRINATLMPISTKGNTITLRKFSRDPWTITKFIESRTMSAEAAALIWLGIQFEMSAIVAGGTASGKTSTMNCLATFFPPNQRIISIEDTRELRLPSFLHWVPMSTRMANPEGKGGVTMEDLLVNALRMRPDRILVGEIRRKSEAETMFEAIHTGHSCYATFHANNSREMVERFTNPPINIPKVMLPAISMIINQFRNRRTGARRTFQVAEIMDDGNANVLQQYDAKKDVLTKQGKSKTLYNSLSMYTGMSHAEIDRDIKQKAKVLQYMVKQKLYEIEQVGRVMAEYYINQKDLLAQVNSSKPWSQYKNL